MDAKAILRAKLSTSLALIALLIKINYIDGFLNENGVVVPKDPVKFVGETLILYCNITNDDLFGDSKDLYFEMKRNREVRKIDPKYVEAPTTKSVRLRLDPLTLEDDGVYSCYMRAFSKDKYIGHQIVSVDYQPRPVNDLSCRVFNWEKMQCNWSLDADFQHLDDVEVRLIWTVSGDQKHCPQMSASKTSCTWPPSEYFHGYEYFMKIVVQNRRRKEAKGESPQFKVKTKLYDNSSSLNEDVRDVIVQLDPAPVNNLLASELNSTCISLTWQHSARERDRKVFIGEYRWGSSHWKSLPLGETKTMNTTVCGLHPNTEYTFRMKVMPYPEYTGDPTHSNGFASAWRTVTAKTWDDVPKSSPQMCVSCFFDHPCHEENSTFCPVRIYWQEVPVSERHGDITGYQLNVTKKSTLIEERHVAKKMKYYDITLPSIKEEYRVTLRAGTRKGYSHNSSEIFLPSKFLRPKQPENFLVQKESDKNGQPTYYLLWDQDLGRNTVNKKIIVVWCLGNIPDFTCQGNINWTSLSGDKPNHIITPNMGEETQGDLIFGIAREVHHQKRIYSSGIHWASCIYHKSGKRPSAPSDVLVTSVPQTLGLSVSWAKNDCPMDRVHVTGYAVSLCPTLDQQTCVEASRITVRVNNTRTFVKFENLQSQNKYLVHVWAESNSVDGPKSAPVIGHVTEIDDEGMDKNATIIIIVCGVVLFIAVLLCIFCARRYWVYRREKILSWDKDDLTSYPNSDYLVSNMHVQNRPLPAVPKEDPHYGLNACMNNLGSEIKSPTPYNGSINSKIPFVKEDTFQNKFRLGEENTHQPLLAPHAQNIYEENVGMYPLPNANNETLAETTDASYETPISEMNDTGTPKISRQSIGHVQDPNFNGSAKTRHSSYFLSHLSPSSQPVSDSHIAPSDSPPVNVAPAPPSTRVHSLPYSPESCQTLHSQRQRDLNLDPRETNLSPLPRAFTPNSEIPWNNLSKSPKDSPLPNGYFKFASNDQSGDYPKTLDSRRSSGHSDLVDSCTSSPYPYPVNSKPLNGYSSFVSDPYFQMPIERSKHVDSHPDTPKSNIVQTPNGYSKNVPSDSSDYCQTLMTNGCLEIADSLSQKQNDRPTFDRSNPLPNGYLHHPTNQVPNRNSVTLNFPPPPSYPPPSYPPPSSETKV